MVIEITIAGIICHKLKRFNTTNIDFYMAWKFIPLHYIGGIKILSVADDYKPYTSLRTGLCIYPYVCCQRPKLPVNVEYILRRCMCA